MKQLTNLSSTMEALLLKELTKLFDSVVITQTKTQTELERRITTQNLGNICLRLIFIKGLQGSAVEVVHLSTIVTLSVIDRRSLSEFGPRRTPNYRLWLYAPHPGQLHWLADLIKRGQPDMATYVASVPRLGCCKQPLHQHKKPE